MKPDMSVKTKLLHDDECVGSSGPMVRPPPYAPGFDQYDHPSAPPQPATPLPRVSAKIDAAQTVAPQSPSTFASPEDILENRRENLARQSQNTVYNQTIYVQAPVPDLKYHSWDGASPCYITRQPPRESVCCPLVILLLGFSCPVLWLGGCCYLSARTARVRFLGRMALFAFLLVAASSLIVTLHINARTGQWPWNACFWSGQRC
jgi:hypothetical protein